MRLFTGLDVPDGPRQALGELLDRLRPLAPGLKWVPVANLHVTLKFIGEWREERLEELRAALAHLPPPPVEFGLDFDGLGWFPNPHQPRVFFCAVHAPAELTGLAAGIEAAVAALGVAREDRPFRPHLTLARISGPAADLAALRRAVALLNSTSFGHAEAHAFHLYQSEAGRYIKLATYPLRSVGRSSTV